VVVDVGIVCGGFLPVDGDDRQDGRCLEGVSAVVADQTTASFAYDDDDKLDSTGV
jgi:hypothetical protein